METNAQLCTGALGEPVISNSFGTGPGPFGGAYQTIWGIEFQYVAGVPEKGQYTITKNNFGMNSGLEGWFQIEDHTQEIDIGYMMIANGDETTRTIFQFYLNALCLNTSYQFSMDVMNLLNHSGAKPNITFQIVTPNGTVIATHNTLDIPESTQPTWLKKAIVFNSGPYTDLTVKIISNGATGDGNDFAVDDMELRACGPVISSTLGGSTNLTREVCYGDNPTITLSAGILAGFNNPEFQWEINIGGMDIPNWTKYTGLDANTSNISIKYTNANIGKYEYRLLVAEAGNINSSKCRVISDIYTVNINKLPEVLSVIAEGSTCEGGEVTFVTQFGSNVAEIYDWTGPNNFKSTLKNPTIKNLTQANSGVYSIAIKSINGCFTTFQIELKVDPAILGTTNISEASICLNESVGLQAAGGTTYKWLPAESLSNPNIANPIANPSQTTEYKVTISNGGQCSVEKSILIIVKKEATADAGKDQSILKGKSTTLNGSVNGEGISNYYWSPIDYLDDPKSLNPIASPPTSITYTFHVETACNVSSDEVKVAVFPSIEVPNTFSPNGDGINDIWNIPSIATFLNPKLIVVNRYGQPVFESYDNKPWDGKSKGKELPTGAYFYTLYINKEYKIYSGWVLLTR